MEDKIKKQKIRPLHILRFIWLAILLALIGCGLYLIIDIFIRSRYNDYDLIGLAVGIPMATIFMAIFILDFRKGVEFNENSIYVPADPKLAILCRVQHKTTIQYNEVEDIKFKESNRDSVGKYLDALFPPPMPYIVFVCKNGKEKAINVYYYTKKQTIQIIDEAKRRAAEVGNVLEIESGEVLLKEFLQKVKNRRKPKK